MSEERLKEIQKSIFNNLLPTTDVDWYTSEVVNEELELYNEVVRLREIIDKTNKYLDKLIEYGIRNEDDDLKEMSLLLNDENYIDITTKRLKQYNLTLEKLIGGDNDNN